jgi:hypothetical protein
MSIPMTANDFRNMANKHDRKAAKLVSGDEKDSHNIASLKANKAADCIDAAHRKAAIAETVNESVGNDQPSLLVRQLRAHGHTEKEIQQITERDPAMSAEKYWQD